MSLLLRAALLLGDTTEFCLAPTFPPAALTALVSTAGLLCPGCPDAISTGFFTADSSTGLRELTVGVVEEGTVLAASVLGIFSPEAAGSGTGLIELTFGTTEEDIVTRVCAGTVLP
jgi:hypothetical protein